MMFLSSEPHNSIIAILSTQSLTIQDVYVNLQSRHIIISLPSLYRHIQHLIDQHILLKDHWLLKIHPLRIHERDTLVSNYKKNNQTSVIAQMQEWERLVIHGTSLYDLEHKWIDAVLSLSTVYSWYTYYRYNHHAYFTLGVQQREAQATHIIRKHSDSMGIIWSDSFLDQLALIQQQNIQNNVVLYPISSFSKTPWLCINIYHQRVFELILPSMAQWLFHLFFDTIKNISDWKSETYQSLFHHSIGYDVIIRRDAKHAQKVQKEIIRLINNT